MRTLIAAILTVCSLTGAALAAERQSCEIPGYLLFDGNELKHVAEVVAKEHRLNIAVVGWLAAIALLFNIIPLSRSNLVICASQK